MNNKIKLFSVAALLALTLGAAPVFASDVAWSPLSAGTKLDLSNTKVTLLTSLSSIYSGIVNRYMIDLRGHPNCRTSVDPTLELSEAEDAQKQADVTISQDQEVKFLRAVVDYKKRVAFRYMTELAGRPNCRPSMDAALELAEANEAERVIAAIDIFLVR